VSDCYRLRLPCAPASKGCAYTRVAHGKFTSYGKPGFAEGEKKPGWITPGNTTLGALGALVTAKATGQTSMLADATGHAAGSA
jgi:hypothetical protein